MYCHSFSSHNSLLYLLYPVFMLVFSARLLLLLLCLLCVCVCVYRDEGYTGDSLCMYADTYHDVGPNGDVQDLGLYPDVSNLLSFFPFSLPPSFPHVACKDVSSI